MRQAIQLIIAGILLYAIGEHSYNFYNNIRIIATAGFVTLLVLEKRQIRWAYLLMAFVFNPFVKIRLERDQWHVVDIGVAVVLAIIAGYDLFKTYQLKVKDGV